MDKSTALKYAKEYAKKVKKACSPLAVIVYGSYINGVPTDDSDIDIAVIFDGFTGDFLETSAMLYQITCEVSTTIEPILLDIANDKSGFAHQILKTGLSVA
jgi:predicted nucleotidyltransferase